MASCTSAIDSVRLLPASIETAAAIAMWRSPIASPTRRSSAQRSDGAIRRQATCAARARSIASATSAGGAAWAREATASVRDGSRRSNTSPAVERPPPTRCGSGSAGPERTASSAASNCASVSGAALPLV